MKYIIVIMLSVTNKFQKKKWKRTIVLLNFVIIGTGIMAQTTVAPNIMANTADWTRVSNTEANRTFTFNGRTITVTATLSDIIGGNVTFSGINHTASPNLRVTATGSATSGLVTFTFSEPMPSVHLRLEDFDVVFGVVQYWEPVTMQPDAIVAGWLQTDGSNASDPTAGNPGNRIHAAHNGNNGADGDFSFSGLDSTQFQIRVGGGGHSNFGIEVLSVWQDTDTDDDGIANTLDLDDDNDGILDTDEGANIIANTADWTRVSNTEANRTFTFNGRTITVTATLSDIIGGNVTFSGINHTASPNLRVTATGSATSGLVTFTFSEPMPSVHLRLEDFDVVFGVVQYWEPVTMQPDAIVAGWLQTDGSNASDPTAGNPGNRIHAAHNGNNGADGDFSFSGLGLTQFQIRVGGGSSSNFGIEVLGFGQDTDGDGIADNFDLDSDGDGCPDALEGDGTFSGTNLVISDLPGGNTGAGYTGTSTDPIHHNFGNNVHPSGPDIGLPIATGSQGPGNSQDGTLQDAECATYAPFITKRYMRHGKYFQGGEEKPFRF